ncbi:hypothetical protein BBK82_17105 [Lentzea guizhouensis]|uniref:NB-ARC domain-containing protein n=1 Tax=Lentzea guizhouensis TaxID=1586287 RepID=A0A1B2HIG8_9PSEU|nr:hypothetical protein [Lentzea guizhouensis]ANZ37515.1 hypothetical protein BBK82_17105 [Lentzea guizhouensis]
MSEAPRTANDIGQNHGNTVQAGTVGHISIGGAPDTLPVPRQLPRVVPAFTGRTEHLAALDELLVGRRTIAAVVGAAGIGKTALVVRWAHRVQDRFPDGTLHVDLRGYGPGEPASPSDVLAGFLGALGIYPERVPLQFDDRVAMYRSEVAGKRVLVVLDNAKDVAQVRPLVPGEPGCAVVVTSRADLKGLVVNDGAQRIQLQLFHEHEAVDLVVAVLGRRAQPGAVAELVRACARLPLAIRVAAGRIATHHDLTITELVQELAVEHRRWDALSIRSDENGAVRTVFDWSYRKLPADQQLMFRRLGLHPTPEISAHAAAALFGADLPQVRALLEDLADQHMIEIADRDRYTCHDLLRAYAADLAQEDDDWEQAHRRMIEWYAHHARNAYRMVHPIRMVLHDRFSLVNDGQPKLVFAGRSKPSRGARSSPATRSPPCVRRRATAITWPPCSWGTSPPACWSWSATGTVRGRCVCAASLPPVRSVTGWPSVGCCTASASCTDGSNAGTGRPASSTWR